MQTDVVIITQNARDLTDYLKAGYEVVSVTAQHVALAAHAGNASYSSPLERNMAGNFCFVLRKPSLSTTQ